MRFSGLPRSGVAKMFRVAFAAMVVLAGLAGPLFRVEAAPTPQIGTDGESLFQAKCVACHTLGQGMLVGPDLQEITARRDKVWLKSFVLDPNERYAANDATTQQLLAEGYSVRMPALGLNAAQVDVLLAYLGDADQAAGPPADPAPQPIAALGSAVDGRRAFTGESRLDFGGPACIACHSVYGLGSLGGGTLGPELTHAAQRYPGPSLVSVLGNIAFPTMVGPYANRPLTPQEQSDLAAFMVEVGQGQTPVAAFAAGSITANMWRLLVVGVAGAVALTLLLAVFWPRQRQSISARLRSGQTSAVD